MLRHRKAPPRGDGPLPTQRVSTNDPSREFGFIIFATAVHMNNQYECPFAWNGLCRLGKTCLPRSKYHRGSQSSLEALPVELKALLLYGKNIYHEISPEHNC
jgi:hypothetical protein